MRPALRRIGKAALVLVLTVLVLLVGAEIAASFTKAGNAVYFVEDPEVWITRAPDVDGWTWSRTQWRRCRINNHSLRGPDVPDERDPDELRVLVLGDSFTFGAGVEEEEGYPQLLQARIGPPEQSGVRILNGGANGWDTFWHRLYLEKKAFDDLDPDVVLLGFYWNDVNYDPEVGSKSVDNFIRAKGSWLEPIARWDWARETHLFRWLFTRKFTQRPVPTQAQLAKQRQGYGETIARLLVEPEERAERVAAYDHPDGERPPAFWLKTDTANWKVVRDEMGRIDRLCEERGIAFLVTILPEPTWEGPGPFPAHGRLTAMLDQLGVPWIEMQLDVLPPEAGGRAQRPPRAYWLRYDPVHPSVLGHELIAQKCWRLLAQQGLLPQETLPEELPR